MRGLTKQEATKTFIVEARRLGYNIKSMDNLAVFMRVIWQRPGSNFGWALTDSGFTFLQDKLEIDPYTIDCNIQITSKFLINLDRAMPYPYRLQLGGYGTKTNKIQIFSQEVAVWAALYDKDINRLVNAYNGMIGDK